MVFQTGASVISKNCFRDGFFSKTSEKPLRVSLLKQTMRNSRLLSAAVINGWFFARKSLDFFSNVERFFSIPREDR